MILMPDKLERLVRDILVAVNVNNENARLVAAHLVAADLTGHHTHGVHRLPRCVEEIRRGEVNLSAQLTVVEERPASLLIDGDWGLGPVIAMQTIDLLIEKTRQQGVASAGAFHANDVGRLGGYTYHLAQQGLLGIMTINDGGGSPLIAPWGGIAPLFSTNPLSFAAPRDGKPPICLDMSTSTCAGSHVGLAQKRGESVPPGLIMDAQGKPSTDPNDLSASPPGSLLPLGAPVAGHKGFGLNLMVDILSGILTGAGCSGGDVRETQGIFLLAVDVDAFVGREVFQTQLNQLIDRIQANPTATEVDQIHLPGEQGEQLRQQRLQEGIPLEPVIWQEICTVAEQVGVSSPDTGC